MSVNVYHAPQELLSAINSPFNDIDAICQLVRENWEKYEHVLWLPEDESLNDVYRWTNNIDSSWADEDFGQEKSRRSTSIGDVIVKFKTAYMVDRYGFVELNGLLKDDYEDEE